MCVFSHVAGFFYICFLVLSTAIGNSAEKGNTINGEWEECGKVHASSILRHPVGYCLTGLRKTRKITVQTCGFGAGNRI